MACPVFQEGLCRARQGKNWVYLLEDEKCFSQLGYRLVWSQETEGLLHCSKIHYNGRLKLIYFSENRQSLPYVWPSLRIHDKIIFFRGLLAAILKVQENGFFACRNLDLSLECIFLDPETLEPYLIYLPLTEDANGEEAAEFDRRLQESMLKLIELSDGGRWGELHEISEALADWGGAACLYDRMGKILSDMEADPSFELSDPLRQNSTGRRKIPEKQLILQSADAGANICFRVDKESYRIGRRKDNDGVLEGAAAVSRMHCRVERSGGHYYIVDEKSSYGTFVNDRPCMPGVKKELREGDTVKLANVEFTVKMREG